MSTAGDYSSSSINILDEDSYPYNYFDCFVENDNSFFVTNDNNRKTIKINYKVSNYQRENFKKYTDLSIKCCDDLAYWEENNPCFSVGKCSSKPVYKYLHFKYSILQIKILLQITN